MKGTVIQALSLWLLLLVIGGNAQFHYYSDDELTLISCKASVYATTKYCVNDTASNFKCNCKYKPAMGSLLYCLKDTMKERYEAGFEFFASKCEALKIPLNETVMDKQLINATKYLVNTTAIKGFNKSLYFDSPVYYNKKSYKLYHTAYKARYRNLTDSVYMGSGLVGYWAAIFVFAGIYNLLQRAGFISKYFHSSVSNWVRKHLTLPALSSNKKHTEAISLGKIPIGLLPTRMESLVVFFYFAMTFIFTGVRYHPYFAGNPVFANKKAQLGRYVGDRSGILAIFGFQLTFLFAGRNNFLLWVTGWKQSTFVMYHKWISRFNFILILIHAGAFHQQSVGLGKLESRMKTFWYRWGIVAVTFAACAVFVAMYPIRKRCYEVFLFLHIVFVAIFLVGAWIHVVEEDCGEFAYAMAAIWVFDRVVRIARLVYFGMRNADVQVVSDEVLKVKVARHKLWKAFPGAYGFVHFMTPLTFFQSHPFTIIETSDSDVTFLVKIKGGVTSQIQKTLSKLPNHEGIIKISVEGPYGTHSPVQKYDSVVMYAGGTGISGPYGHALKTVNNGKNQHMKLYWIIRSWSSIDWVHDELLRLKGGAVKVVVYITNPDSGVGLKFKGNNITSSSDSDSKEEKHDDGIIKDEKGALPTGVEAITSSLDFVEFRYGRPNMDELVKNDIQESQGTLAIVTAAHNSVVDDVRSAVSNYLDLSSSRVDYFEELQSW